jgi:hypothetical protein
MSLINNNQETHEEDMQNPLLTPDFAEQIKKDRANKIEQAEEMRIQQRLIDVLEEGIQDSQDDQDKEDYSKKIKSSSKRHGKMKKKLNKKSMPLNKVLEKKENQKKLSESDYQRIQEVYKFKETMEEEGYIVLFVSWFDHKKPSLAMACKMEIDEDKKGGTITIKKTSHKGVRYPFGKECVFGEKEVGENQIKLMSNKLKKVVMGYVKHKHKE